MKRLASLLLLAALAGCASPAPEPDGDVAVLQPGMACRADPSGGPTLAERGIGGTGGPARTQVAERGIGGTGIVGVVTGFASVCVDGLEVRLDRNVPVSVNGAVGNSGQLRVGQLVVIDADAPPTGPHSVTQARSVAVRYEVSGPIEAVDVKADELMVAGQRVGVSGSTWVAGRFSVGTWVTVSGLRQPDGTIIASRLDRARPGVLVVRGKVVREGRTTRIGNLVLRGPAADAVAPGAFVLVQGRYGQTGAEVTSAELDLLSEDPVQYLGLSARRLVVQGFARVAWGRVWLNNGQHFAAGPEVRGGFSRYRDAVVWLERGTDGSFVATRLQYTNYQSQPRPARSGGGGGVRGASPPALPPYLPPEPPQETPAGGAADMEPEASVPAPPDEADGIVEPGAPDEVPTSNVPQVEPADDAAFIAARQPVGPWDGVRVATAAMAR
ncbi:MAG TPA: DUF5666 domain-containing protein [Rhodopila sp.]|jgi:hypothetical protein|nr:DUF5666 domain-containing protein [Rhodopila sp.]